MTMRRSDKTRKPPRRPAARPAARPSDTTKSGEVPSGEVPSDATVSDATVPPATDPAAGQPETAAAAEQASTGESGTGHVTEPSEAEGAPEQAAVEEPTDMAVATGDVPATDEPPVEAAASGIDREIQEHPSSEDVVTADAAHAAPDAVAQEHAVREPVDQEPVLQEPATHEPAVQAPDEASAAATGELLAAATASEEVEPIAVADAGGRNPAPAAEAAPASDREEVPLAAMQGLIEINGRLVAFMQGESQAALAFWKSALAARTPGDLAQLQAAEVSRALDAAIACWTDLAQRMGRFATLVPPRARAA